MIDAAHQIDLGFSAEKVPSGTHMCLIYTSEQERKESLLKFITSGLKDGERVACFTEKETEKTIREYLEQHDVNFDESISSDSLSFAGTGEVYFQEGNFCPERMLNTLKTFYKESKNNGHDCCRVIGEMIPEIENIEGGEKLLEYESRVTLLLDDYPVTSVCQYDAKEFDGATIMEVLKVHPRMIVNGVVVHNPFYIKPEEYLKGR